jgi:hypothetical protein
MEGLDNRDILFLTDLIDRRRYHCKSIVNMNNIWLEISQDAAHSELTVAGRNDTWNQSEALYERQLVDLIVTTLIGNNPVPISPQQFGFLSYYNILSARLLVIVMDNKNVHYDRLARLKAKQGAKCSTLRRARTP